MLLDVLLIDDPKFLSYERTAPRRGYFSKSEPYGSSFGKYHFDQFGIQLEIAIRTKCNYVDKLNGVNEHKNNRWI